MIAAPPFPATLDDLMKVEGKAELIGGRIVEIAPSGHLPSVIACEIAVSLDDYTQRCEHGEVFTSTLVYGLGTPLNSGRQSFSPDVSYHRGPFPANRMSCIEGAPTFAVEVRNEPDYLPNAESEMADKRADYFEAGTLAVWDVDPLAQTVALHTATSETVFRPGDLAHAGPALPGWTLDVTALFA